MSTNSDLHALRLASFEAGKVYYAASAHYFGAISARSPEREVREALDQCIITGEQYRTALKMFLGESQKGGTTDEVKEATRRVERLLELLDMELKKLFALRG